MANITDCLGNLEIIKPLYQKRLGLGEGIIAHDFLMRVEDYPNLTYLVQATQIPGLQRENIESYATMGVQFNQQGRFKNVQDISITILATRGGTGFDELSDWVIYKRYKQVELILCGESYPAGVAGTNWTFEDCWIEIDNIDLSVEDGTTLVKPSGTLHINWNGWSNQKLTGLSLESLAA